MEVQDEFSKLIGEKMRNFSPAPDDACWRELEKRILPKQRKAGLWIWLTSASAAAILALLFMLDPFPLYEDAGAPILAKQQKALPETSSEETSSESASTSLSNLSEEEPELAAVLSKTGRKQSARSDASLPVISPSSVSQELYDEPAEHAPVSRGEAVEEPSSDLPEEKTKEAPEVSNSEVEKTEERSQNYAEALEGGAALTERSFERPRKKANNWTLALSYASSNGRSTTKEVPRDIPREAGSLRYAIRRKSLSSSAAFLEESQFSDIRFSPPLSLGFSLRKDIGKRLGIATGLRYSYLETHFKDNRFVSNDASLQLHYLGIPLNLTYNLYNNSRWHVYFAGGATVEKGVETYEQRISGYRNLQRTITSGPGWIEGLQWSGNVSFGTSYTVYRNFELYAEPSLTYYFDNKQPTSLRTKQPLTVNLSLGLQYRIPATDK